MVRAPAFRYLPILVLVPSLSMLLLQCTGARRSPEQTVADLGGRIVSPARRTGEPRLLSNVRQLTFDGQRSGEGYFSRDGSMLIFQSEREPGNPFYQIYLMDLRTGETHRVSPGYGKTTCAWIHPEREKVLFASTHGDPNARAEQQKELERRAAGEAGHYAWDYDEQFDIFESDLNGTRLENLTHTRGYDAEGSWSPDGGLIVFSSNRHAYTEALSPEDQARFEDDKSYMLDLYLMNADGTDVRRLTDANGADGGSFFSPDGERIVWRRFSVDGATAEIYTMNVDGGDQRPITHLGAMSWAPYFHPSGEYLIFATNLHGFGNFELYVVDTQGSSEPVRVTFKDGFDGLPVFSPGGNILLWTSNRTATKQSQLFIAEWNDAEARRLLRSSRKGERQPATVRVPSLPAPDVTQTVPAITIEDLRTHIGYLASGALSGRLTGTEGARRAAEYVATILESSGFDPAGDDGTFFQGFDFTAGVSLGPENALTLDGGNAGEMRELVVDRDWRPLALSKTGIFAPAEVVFAGYGIVAPGDTANDEYDSYANLDVTGKWVLVFRYLPEGLAPEVRRHLLQHAHLRYKAMVARDRGARGLIVASGPTSNVKEDLIKLAADASLAGTSLAAISVTDAVAEQLLEPVGERVRELQEALDRGERVAGFPIPGRTLHATIDIRHEKRTGRNVLARLRARDAHEGVVVIGAHIDHLGEGFGTATLARTEEEGMIHYGADDNASGVAGVIEIAQYLAHEKARGTLALRRDLLFAFWSGEELGLLGSAHFTRTFGGESTEPSSLSPSIAACLNMDMIGRLGKHLILFGVGSSPIWPGEIERHNVPVGLPIVTQNTGYLATDATSFYIKEVPVLSAFTGAHEDYHTPRDTADRINYAGAHAITQFMASVARSLATAREAPEYVAMEKPGRSFGRGSLRAYLGTIPDYAAGDILGVRLTGVAKGGPADRAGVQGGDVVVELAGKKVDNLYDYTYALELLKLGVPVDLTVRRGERHITLTVTPESRD